jgi:hypothetical protein
MELVVLRQWEDQVRYQRLSHIKIFKIKQITINKDTKTNLNLTHTHKLLQNKKDVQYTRYIHSAGGSQIKVENFCSSFCIFIDRNLFDLKYFNV